MDVHTIAYNYFIHVVQDKNTCLSDDLILRRSKSVHEFPQVMQPANILFPHLEKKSTVVLFWCAPAAPMLACPQDAYGYTLYSGHWPFMNRMYISKLICDGVCLKNLIFSFTTHKDKQKQQWTDWLQNKDKDMNINRQH